MTNKEKNILLKLRPSKYKEKTYSTSENFWNLLAFSNKKKPVKCKWETNPQWSPSQKKIMFSQMHYIDHETACLNFLLFILFFYKCVSCFETRISNLCFVKLRFVQNEVKKNWLTWGFNEFCASKQLKLHCSQAAKISMSQIKLSNFLKWWMLPVKTLLAWSTKVCGTTATKVWNTTVLCQTKEFQPDDNYKAPKVGFVVLKINYLSVRNII